MAKISGFPKTRPFLDENMILNPEGRAVVQELEERVPVTGSGSPEGVVEAPVGATYYDVDASTGSIHYVKLQQSIGGDRTKGWTLV